MLLTKKQAEEYKEELKKELEESKKKLLEEIDNVDSEKFNKFKSEYTERMNIVSKDEDVEADALEKVQKEFYDNISTKKDLSKFENEYEEAKKEIGENIKTNFKEFKNGKNVMDFFSNVGKVAKGAFVDTQESFESSKELNKVKDEIKKESFEQLKNYMNEEFNKDFTKKKLFGIETSEAFWQEKCSEFKEKLRNIISGSEGLDDEKKNELEQIILKFEKIDLETPTDAIFKDNNLIIYGLNEFFEDLLHFKFKNLAEKYNTALEEQITKMKDIIRSSHENNFNVWKNRLIKTIKDDILNYSPILHEKQKRIDDQQMYIDKLKTKLDKLTVYSNQINDMLKWKESMK